MTSSAASAARTILTRLHEVMASRSHAQAKLNTVVEVIGESLNSGDGVVPPTTLDLIDLAKMSDVFEDEEELRCGRVDLGEQATGHRDRNVRSEFAVATPPRTRLTS